jgi:rhodanese-related sulfurtransferase
MRRIVTHREVLPLAVGGGQVIDVLPEHEYRESHIQGARHLPLKSLMREANTLDKDRPVVVYCRDSL